MKVIEIKRSLSLLSGLILAATTWVVSLELISDRPVPNAIFAQSIIERKMEAAEKPGKVSKTLVVGGSNVAFGIDTVRMSRTIGEEFVNFGCIAGIGPRSFFPQAFPKVTGFSFVGNTGSIVLKEGIKTSLTSICFSAPKGKSTKTIPFSIKLF